MTLKTMLYITTDIQPFLKDIDANWITGSTETKSTSGYVFTIGGGAISWKSSKTCIARSTMESEFIALGKAGEEA